MLARCYFGYHATETLMDFYLRCDYVAYNPLTAGYDGDAGFVAGSLDPEHQAFFVEHLRSITHLDSKLYVFVLSDE